MMLGDTSKPNEVLETLNTTINEAAVSYKNKCRLATIVLCGKIIETLLKRAYQAEYGEDPDSREKRRRLEMPAIRAALRTFQSTDSTNLKLQLLILTRLLISRKI